MNRRFDAIVIGAGQAGPPMVGRLRRRPEGRADRARADRRDLRQHRLHADQDDGRERLCGSSREARADFGVKVGPVGIDFAAVMARKDDVVGDSRSHLTAWLEGMANCTVVRGHARFLSPTTVQWATTCSRPSGSSSMSAAGQSFRTFPVAIRWALTNTTLLELDALPKRLVVVGGSYIGLEFAQVFRRLARTGVERCRAYFPRGQRSLGCDPRNPRGGGHEIRLESQCIQFEPRGAEIRSASIAPPANPRS